MRVFHFKLEKLLKYRKYLELQEKQKFAQVLQEYVAIQNKIEVFLLRQTEMLKVKSQMTQKGILAYLFFHDQAMKVIQSEIYKLESELAKKAEPLKEAQARLNNVIMQRKVLDVLKRKAQARYMQEFEKEEQAILDEHASHYVNTEQR